MTPYAHPSDSKMVRASEKFNVEVWMIFIIIFFFFFNYFFFFYFPKLQSPNLLML